MGELTDILDQFNRKERNLLIRDALEPSLNKLPPLNEAFRKRIGDALVAPPDKLEIPEYAWWATDYHLNWIAGALVIWRYGEKMIEVPQSNLSAGSKCMLIERSQEDVDFLIAFDTTMILVEVKAFGHFSNKQINSKRERWRLLKRQSESLGSNVTFHFMLMSQAKPTLLNPPPDDLLPGRNEWPHAELKVDTRLRKLKVSGKRHGTSVSPVDTMTWFIVPVPGGEDHYHSHEY